MRVVAITVSLDAYYDDKSVFLQVFDCRARSHASRCDLLIIVTYKLSV